MMNHAWSRTAYFLVLLLGFLISGCATFSVHYDLDDIRVVKDPDLAKIQVRIAPLRDLRAGAEPEYVFSAEREVDLAGGKTCINAEKNYDSAVPGQIATMIAAHLSAMQTYASVSVGGGGPGAYVLTGTLRRFYGAQKSSTAAKVGAAFGLIGALATMDAKTDGVVDVELTNLELVGPGGATVAHLEDVSAHYDGELPADAGCNAIYQSVNERLKQAVQRLAFQVAEQIRKVASAPRPASEGPPVG